MVMSVTSGNPIRVTLVALGQTEIKKSHNFLLTDTINRTCELEFAHRFLINFTYAKLHFLPSISHQFSMWEER